MTAGLARTIQAGYCSRWTPFDFESEHDNPPSLCGFFLRLLFLPSPSPTGYAVPRTFAVAPAPILTLLDMTELAAFSFLIRRTNSVSEPSMGVHNFSHLPGVTPWQAELTRREARSAALVDHLP